MLKLDRAADAPPTERISFRVTPLYRGALEELARAEETNISGLVRLALEDKYPSLPRTARQLDEALTSVAGN